MGLIIAILLVIGVVSWFISRAVYKTQVRNNYKSPKATAVIVFILSFAIIAAALFYLLISNISMSRR